MPKNKDDIKKTPVKSTKKTAPKKGKIEEVSLDSIRKRKKKRKNRILLDLFLSRKSVTTLSGCTSMKFEE